MFSPLSQKDVTVKLFNPDLYFVLLLNYLEGRPLHYSTGIYITVEVSVGSFVSPYERCI